MVMKDGKLESRYDIGSTIAYRLEVLGTELNIKNAGYVRKNDILLDVVREQS